MQCDLFPETAVCHHILGIPPRCIIDIYGGPLKAMSSPDIHLEIPQWMPEQPAMQSQKVDLIST